MIPRPRGTHRMHGGGRVVLAAQQTPITSSPKSSPPLLGRRPGSLVIVGSGIKAIGQVTFEAEAYVRWADIVYFNVPDPATANWIVQKSYRAIDLSQLYDRDKLRATTYVQMAEVMLQSVRQGRNVVGIFYGHPGVFVDSSHRAITIARREGYAAHMLPAVSALDCLFADLGVDPGRTGCQIVGATDLLLRRRPLLTESNVIILQVGVVGELGFRPTGYPNSGLPVLGRYLQETYGDEHPIVHYIAAEYPTADPTVEQFTVAALQGADVRKRVNELSTFYLPPKEPRSIDPEMSAALGLAPFEADTDAFHPALGRYTGRELEAVAKLRDERQSDGRRRMRPSAELARFLEDLALDPRLLHSYESNPQHVLEGRPGLTDVERAALLGGDPGWLRLVMQRSSVEVAREFVRRAVDDALTARRYQELLKTRGHPAAGDDSVQSGLRDLGYDTGPEEILQAFDYLAEEDLGLWANRYELVVEGRRRGTLTVAESGVLLDRAPVIGYRFEAGVLSWSAASGNQSSAALRFLLLIDVDGKPLPPDAYLGPQFRGELWAGGASRPDGANAFGKVGVYAAGCLADPLGTDSLQTWAGRYTTRVSTSAATWLPGPDVEIRAATRGPKPAELLISGQTVEDFAYANGTLSWAQSESWFSGTILFHRQGEQGGARLVGRLWRGPGQRTPSINCVGQSRTETDDRLTGLPALIETGMAATSHKVRAASLAAAAAVISQRGAPAEAVLERAFIQPRAGDLARVDALLELGALATRRGRYQLSPEEDSG
jgi:Tetrapyrrole (Corrin/Porphyrin) Methylases